MSTSGFQIKGTDIGVMLAFTGTDDTSTFRSYFSSTAPRSLPQTTSNPSICSITNSSNATFNCYRVPTTFGSGTYTTPTVTTGDWSGLKGYSIRYSANNAAQANAPGAGAAPINVTSGTFPRWCNSVLIYSVGGGGGGGSKGSPAYYGAGQGADGANGRTVNDTVNNVSGLSYTVYAGGGGGGGQSTGNDQGTGLPGAASYIVINGTTYAWAMGGAAGRQGNSASGNTAFGNGGNNGGLQVGNADSRPFDAANMSTLIAADNPDPAYPPTLQVARQPAPSYGNSDSPSSSIGGFGIAPGAQGTPGYAGMVALFFKYN